MIERASPASDRIDEIDALRGLALFGILFANILYWSGWGLVTDSERAAMAGPQMQMWQYRFHHMLIDGKFYSLFSLLFGAGFALQLDRLTRRGVDGLRLYRRRVAVLLIFGLLHSLVIWDGDILTLYALMGFLLPVFCRWRDRDLLLAAAILIFVIPAVGVSLFEAMDWHPEASIYAFSDHLLKALGYRPGADLAMRMLPDAGLREVVSWNFSGTAFSLALRLESWRIPKVLGIMLLGIWTGRRLAAGTLLDDHRLLWLLFVVGLLVGLPFTVVYALTPGLEQSSLASIFGTVPLAIAYASAFALAWPHMSRWLGILAAPGRMALTNYLTHSVVGALIFYGIGFGLIGRLSPPAFYTVACLIFIAQIALSRWWLARHAQGPMEALWRQLTYGRRALAGKERPR